MCENNGGLYVKNAALSPDKITSIWKEYKGRKWRTQHSIRVTCNGKQHFIIFFLSFYHFSYTIESNFNGEAQSSL